MENFVFEEIKGLLENPSDENIESFWDSNALTMIDYREYEGNLIDSINWFLYDEDEVEYEIIENEKIILKNNEKILTINYDENKYYLDIVLNGLKNFLKEDYKILLFKETEGYDTLGFTVLENHEIEELKNKFGNEIFDSYFGELEEEIFG